MPPKGTLLLEREQITREIVVAYVDCGGCEGKGVQIHKNQGQGFLLKKQVRNMQSIPRSMELKRRRSKERKDNESGVYKVQKKRYNCEKDVRMIKKKNFMPRIQGRKKKRVVELERSSVPHRGKSTVKWYMDRNSKRYSERGK